MHLSSKVAGWLVLGITFASAGIAQTKAPTIDQVKLGPAVVPLSQEFEFRSRINGESYRVQVFQPSRKPAPASGYPTLYVLDGNVLFNTFASAVRNRSQAGEIQPAVVVGISSGERFEGADRTFDFSSADMTDQEKGLMKDLGPNPRFGGANKFYRVIQEEIKPEVAKLAPVDPSRDILFGWSLGGLFTIHGLLEHPNDYKTFVALSPSLWRSDRAVFHEIPRFEGQVVADGVIPGLFLGVGSREEEAPVGFLANEFKHEELVAAVTYAKMVGNLEDLSATLQPFFEQRTLPFVSKVFDGETHNSVPWTAVNPVLSFALSK